MKIIGLTGGSGAGKGIVSERFKALGAGVVDADAVYHELCIESSQMLCDIQKEFGDVLTQDGKLDRAKLAKIVFSDTLKLGRLNHITFPYIKEESIKRFDLLKDKKIIIYDAPTLFQAGADCLCDDVIAVIADKKTRIDRIIKRDNISEQAAQARIEAQPHDNFYRTRCKYIIENNSTKENVEKQIDKLFKKLAE